MEVGPVKAEERTLPQKWLGIVNGVHLSPPSLPQGQIEL